MIGLLPRLIFTAHDDFFRQSCSRQSSLQWCFLLICEILLITHRQWIFRYQWLHFVASDGLTNAGRTLLHHQINSQLSLGCDGLTPSDFHLENTSFAKLCNQSSLTQNLRLSNIEAAPAYFQTLA